MSTLNWNLYYGGYIGLSNARMSAELAIATSYSLGMDLNMAIYKSLQHSQKKITELFDFHGVNIVNEKITLESNYDPIRCCVIGKDSYNVDEFVGDRRYVLPNKPNSTLNATNETTTLGFYSNLVCGSGNISEHINKSMTPKYRYVECAQKIIQDIGTNNYMSIHIRRGDKLVSGQPDVMFDSMKSIIVNNVRDKNPDIVVIHTDEQDMSYFSRSVLGGIGVRSIILESAFYRELRGMDMAETGLVSCLVASESSGFVGTLGSTMTSMMQRGRMLNGHCEDFRFLFPMFGADIDNLGRFFVSKKAAWSWDRYKVSNEMYPINFWAREWPESIM